MSATSDRREMIRLAARAAELERENIALRARCDRQQTFITAIRTLGQADYAVAHLLRSCGIDK